MPYLNLQFRMVSASYVPPGSFVIDMRLVQAIMIKFTFHVYNHYGSTGCQVFKLGVQNQKDFCLRINIPKGNYCILRIGVIGRCQKVPKLDLQSQFSLSKVIRIFLIFFFIEEYQFRSMFFVFDIFR